MAHKIAVLFHEKQRGQELNYLVHHYAEFWREDGHEVVFIFGTSQFIPADLIIVHVDLTVVPAEYLAFAHRYPIVLNGDIKDIRKSTYSGLLVRPSDGYSGKVIVKSNFNFAGSPERALNVPLDPRGVSSSYFWSPQDYQVYQNPGVVPALLFDDPNVVVERFQPEFHDGLYYMRAMLFLGDRATCTRFASREPIVNGSTQISSEHVEPHPEMMQLAKAMKFDYGKFDYVLHEGKPVLLDANKTTGGVTASTDPKKVAGRRYRAEGLYQYFK
ncbi:MAG TPA: hypothetical protein VG938_03215 [Verrucomicrobiae bacterium]|jgi:hypothetical protein|nr:hypothetical protein [Verrucomicrobiae bacterium]